MISRIEGDVGSVLVAARTETSSGIAPHEVEREAVSELDGRRSLAIASDALVGDVPACAGFSNGDIELL
ncbi:MAG: hypothetical protein DI639_01145 [Leifsonia xyli]|nr:MAG: hypothetical protein DI639_01145 [Leifsonia xyli]